MAMVKASRPRGYRMVDTRRGDTPQSVAARELGDANRWPEVVAINGLAPPWIVDTLAGLENTPEGRVALAGQQLKVPAPPRRPSAVADGDVFGTDVLLGSDGDLPADSETGDWALVSGPPNLRQALVNRLETPLGELERHPRYGCGAHRLKGKGGSAGRGQLGAVFLERAIRGDPRIDRVEDAKAAIIGDRLAGSATAVATDGKRLPVALGGEGE